METMTEKDLAIAVIAMQMSKGMEDGGMSFEQAQSFNRKNGWLVIFPIEAKEGHFTRKRVQLGESDMEIAWEQASRLHGYKEPSFR